ncbi:MAG: SpoVG family protein [Candidatus Gracilibacteria bacterium]|nr:SpoVG family protein [Candidatus Gracilibacteria bacterium]
MTKISEIQIIPIKPQKGLLAFANFVLDEKLFVSSVAIHTKIDGSGYRITYPKKNQFDLFHPINRETSKTIEKAVISKFKNVMKLNNDRYNSPFDTTR